MSDPHYSSNIPLLRRHIPIKDIIVDEKIQPREALNPVKVAEYAENFRSGIKMPPIRIHEIDGKLWVCDGFTRLAGMVEAGKKELKAIVREKSTYGALMIEAIRLNSIHGQPLKRSERRAALLKVIEMFRESGVPWTVDEVSDISGYTPLRTRQIINEVFGDLEYAQKADPELEKAMKALEQERYLASQEDPFRPESADDRTKRIYDEMQESIKPARYYRKQMSQALRKVSECLNHLALIKGGELIAEELDRYYAARDELVIAKHLVANRACDLCFGAGCTGCNNQGWILDRRGREIFFNRQNVED